MPRRHEAAPDRKKQIAAAVLALLALDHVAKQKMRSALVSTAAHMDAIGASRLTTAFAVKRAAARTAQDIRQAARARSGAAWREQSGLALSRTEAEAETADAASAESAGDKVAARFVVAAEDAETYEAAAEEAAPYSGVVATYETVESWDDEREALTRKALGLGYSVVSIWRAEADACDVCADQDGREFEDDDEPSIGWPPAHPSCRCQVSTEIR